MNIILYGHELCIFLALSLSTTVVVNYGTNKYMLGKNKQNSDLRKNT